MKKLFWVMVTSLLLLPVASCGYKGKLQSPEQAAIEEARKARRAEKEARRNASSQSQQAEQPTTNPEQP